MRKLTTSQINARVEEATQQTISLWHQWEASPIARTFIKAQIDAIDAEIRSLLEV